MANIILTEDFVMVCEGLADKEFFDNLLRARNLTRFDVLAANGWQSFNDLVQRLSSYFELKPEQRDKTRGLLIVADARDNPSQTFQDIAGLIPAELGYGVPVGELQVGASLKGLPPVAIMLIPGGIDPSSLETLCVEAMLETKPDLRACVETFLSCGSINARNWSREKQDKARLQCLIASTNENDPNKGVSHAFGESSGPIIDVRSVSFDRVVTALTQVISRFQSASS
jgi:hypothetical protein